MARYKVIADSGGRQVRFFCDLSGELRHSVVIPAARDETEAVRLAWDSGGRGCFNLCPKCGRWVSEVMFNADAGECVACAPWQEQPRFCPHCAKPLLLPGDYCPHSGVKLRYEGGDLP